MNRIDEIRKVSESLLDDLESSKLSIDPILMKAKRLARLMRDSDAQTWLDLETKGYPEDFSFSELGSCLKYTESSGRIDIKNSKYWIKSLPELEADTESEEAQLDSLRMGSNSPSNVTNYLEKRATEGLMSTQLKVQTNQKKNYAKAKAIFSSLKSGIHNYATETYIAVELGDVAKDIFDGARNVVDSFVRSHCPKAAEKLIAINERRQIIQKNLVQLH